MYGALCILIPLCYISFLQLKLDVFFRSLFVNSAIHMMRGAGRTASPSLSLPKISPSSGNIFLIHATPVTQHIACHLEGDNLGGELYLSISQPSNMAMLKEQFIGCF